MQTVAQCVEVLQVFIAENSLMMATWCRNM